MSTLLAIIGWCAAVALGTWAVAAERHYVVLAARVAGNYCEADVKLNGRTDGRPDDGVRAVRISYDGTEVRVGPPAGGGR